MGSALSFIDATVVNIALPQIGEDLGVGAVGLTWVVNAYGLTLAALVLLGGALGDRLGRRSVFMAGVGLFAAASALCGLAPDEATLIAARAIQGVGGAMVVPASLAILQAAFSPEDRGRAIGAWSGLTGVAAAIGPFLGGWLVEAASWRWVFLINLPVAALVIVVSRRHVPESRDPDAATRVDTAGAALLAGALGCVTYGLTALSTAASTSATALGAITTGVLLGVAFLVWEHRATSPLLPLGIFRSSLFVSSNVVTLAVYAALGALFFSFGLVLQVGAGYSPLAAGTALLPVTVLMLAFSAQSGAFMARVGPRIPMTAGPAIAAVGVALLVRIDEDTSYVRDVLGPVVLLGAGLTMFVGPLTATVLAAVHEGQAGLASGVNNAVARTAGLLAIAALPWFSGLGGSGALDSAQVLDGFTIVTRVCAGLLLAGAVVSAFTVIDHRSKEAGPPHRYCSLNTPPVEVPTAVD
jgi:EmrB/QacA subfamily drug resistance transporter